MSQQFTHKNCSLESINKKGKTRLHLSENDVNSYLTNCVLTEEDEEPKLFEELE